MYFKNNTGWHSTAFRLFESLTFTEYYNQSVNKKRHQTTRVGYKPETGYHSSQF